MSSDDAIDTPDEDETSRRQKAVEGFDAGVEDLLSWVLDTETRAKIYVFLRANPSSTSEEVAKGTGLYPSTVREALAELHDEEKVHREKRESKGAGNNPYEYTAIPPSELVSGVVGQVQDELNTVFNLDDLLERSAGADEDDDVTVEERDEPVTITVESEDVDAPGGADHASSVDDGDAKDADDASDADDGIADDGSTGDARSDE